MVRYFKNNFEDGFRQDAIDLVLGNYQVKVGEGNTVRCPLASRNVLKIFTVILVLWKLHKNTNNIFTTVSVIFAFFNEHVYLFYAVSTYRLVNFI